MAAVFLALFGAASLHNAGANGGLQLLLALVMGGAGVFLPTGTAEARLFGLAAAGLTAAVGGYALVFQNDYFVGTIIAVFAIFRLWSVGNPVLTQAPAAAPNQPMTMFDAPGPYGGVAFAPQPTDAPTSGPYTPEPYVPAPYTPAPYAPAPYSAAPAPAPFFPAAVQHPDDPA